MKGLSFYLPLAFSLVLSTVAPASAWSPDTQIAIAEEATKVVPHDLRRQIRRHKKAFARGADDNELLQNVPVDPLMGGTARRTTFVTFERAESEVMS